MRHTFQHMQSSNFIVLENGRRLLSLFQQKGTLFSTTEQYATTKRGILSESNRQKKCVLCYFCSIEVFFLPQSLVTTLLPFSLFFHSDLLLIHCVKNFFCDVCPFFSQAVLVLSVPFSDRKNLWYEVKLGRGTYLSFKKGHKTLHRLLTPFHPTLP